MQARCLVVRSGGEQFGVPTSRVLKVLRNHPIYPVPGSTAPMVGLAQVGGEPVVIVDLKELVDGRVGAEDHRLILLIQTEAGGTGRTVGLAIDEALEMVPMPAVNRGWFSEGVIVGSTTFDGRPVRIVDPERVIGPSSRPAAGRLTDR